jgi:hypothetical protein
MLLLLLLLQGQEASTYELIISINNTCLTISTVLATQLLTPFHCIGCTDSGTCDSRSSVDISSAAAYESSHGPYRFTVYCVSLCFISIAGCLLFTPFLPSGKAECAVLRDLSEASSDDKRMTRGLITCVIAVSVVTVRYTDSDII